MVTLRLTDEYAAVAPVIVTSPTQRCGTTLVQRLLSASDNAFIYGEEVGGHVKRTTEDFVGQIKFLESRGLANDAQYDRALAGKAAEWQPGLMPPSDVMLEAWTATYYQLPVVLQKHAQAAERPIWGFKYPGYGADMIKAVLSFMPKARFVYVFRNLFDVLKSAKARKFVQTPEKVAEFCDQWARNMADLSVLSEDERILFIKYESLLEQPEDHVRLLELVTGAENIDAAVFQIKVNTFAGSREEGHSPDQYIPPAALTEAERAMIHEKAGPVMAHLYGEMLVAQ